MTQFLFSESGAQYRFQFRFAEPLECGSRLMPNLQVREREILRMMMKLIQLTYILVVRLVPFREPPPQVRGATEWTN